MSLSEGEKAGTTKEPLQPAKGAVSSVRENNLVRFELCRYFTWLKKIYCNILRIE